MRSRKRLTMSKKWILSFPQNWVVGNHINMFQKNTRHITRQNLKNEHTKREFWKCTYEKIVFKLFGAHKDEKNSYFSAAYTNLAEIRLWDIRRIHVLILQSSSKSVEQSVVFRSSIWQPQYFRNIPFSNFWSNSAQFLGYRWLFYGRPSKLITKIP